MWNAGHPSLAFHFFGVFTVIMQKEFKSAKYSRKEAEWTEQRVLRELGNYGTVRPSLRYENIHQDIDGHVNWTGWKYFEPISIKVNEPEYHSHPFIFELRQGWIKEYVTEQQQQSGILIHPLKPSLAYHELELEDGEKVPVWVEDRLSWYYTGQATRYFIWKRDTPDTGWLYSIDKKRLRAYVDHNGWESITQSKKRMRTREVEEGKAYTILGTLSIGTVIQNDLGCQFAYIQRSNEDNERLRRSSKSR